MIYLKLFLSFLQIGCFSIGGGYAAIPLIQSQAVQTCGWLSMSEFTDLITIAEMTPGPIAVNSATFVGIRVAGIPGAIAATCGCVLPSCVIVSILAWLYYKYKGLSTLQSVLACLRPAVVALIAGAGVSIFLQMLFGGLSAGIANINWIGLLLFAGGFFLIRFKKWSPILTMALCGLGNLILSLLFQAA